MSDWKKYKLGELLSIKHGWAFKSENYVKDSKTALVTLRNISEDSRFVFDVNKTTYYGGEYPEEYNLNEGDLIIPLTEQVIGLLGNSAFIPNFGDIKFVLNQRVGKVQEKYKKIDKIFLKYLLSTTTVRTQMEYRASGTKQRNISPKDIYDIEVYVPELVIQKYIGQILYNLDKKIQINNQINQELEAMAKTLYDYWFVQFDFPDQNGNPYKSSGGKMVYHPELKREIPEGWGVEKLGDITICHDSKRVPLSSNDRELVKGEIPYYGATGIMDYVNDYIFDGDYVLMAEDGSVMTEKGTPILQRISGKNWVNNHAHVLEPIKNYSCKLLMMLLKDVSVMKIKTGSIQMKINQENMNKIVVPAIPLKLLFEINQKLEVIDKQQLNLIEENKQLTQLRDWLLPMLMNGQVKVE